eukprot:302265-Pelagomonas_calceolata.AAC.6
MTWPHVPPPFCLALLALVYKSCAAAAAAACRVSLSARQACTALSPQLAAPHHLTNNSDVVVGMGATCLLADNQHASFTDARPPSLLYTSPLKSNTRLSPAGRLAVIVRMGATKLRNHLPGFVKAVQEAGQVVTWISDPMHGNTETVVGYKTRRFDNIRGEIEAFFDVHEAMGSVAGGVHVEMTGVHGAMGPVAIYRWRACGDDKCACGLRSFVAEVKMAGVHGGDDRDACGAEGLVLHQPKPAQQSTLFTLVQSAAPLQQQQHGVLVTPMKPL